MHNSDGSYSTSLRSPLHPVDIHGGLLRIPQMRIHPSLNIFKSELISEACVLCLCIYCLYMYSFCISDLSVPSKLLLWTFIFASIGRYEYYLQLLVWPLLLRLLQWVKFSSLLQKVSNKSHKDISASHFISHNNSIIPHYAGKLHKITARYLGQTCPKSRKLAFLIWAKNNDSEFWQLKQYFVLKTKHEPEMTKIFVF